MTERPLRKRLLFYLILSGLCCVVPILTTMFIIMVSGDRELGMRLAVIPSIAITHYVFSAIFLEAKPLIKFTVPLLTALIAILGLKFLLPLKIIHHLFDMYGFWDIAITHLFTTVIIWEIVYQTLIKFKTVKQ